MYKILVLGAGRVGSTIARDMQNKYDVTAIDMDLTRVEYLNSLNIKAKQADFSNSGILKGEVTGFDLVISAVPGFMGFETLKTIIEAGKNVVDISFFEEDPFLLDKLAKDKNITAITDCGVAPGMSHIILGYYNKIMQVREFAFYVGGLPFVRTYPMQYKAPFSPLDVIEIYTRPARIIENNKVVIKPAISDLEYLEFENVGTLVAFNSDGLRTLLKTIPVPEMKEKTLRYPGHIEYMKFLRDCGFFNQEEIALNGNKVKPADITARLLFPLWQYKPDEEDFTVMRIIISGIKDGKDYKVIFDMFDRAVEGISSMSRTTGYTCSAAANLILENKFTRKGICPPEYLGEDETCFNFIVNYLKDRNVIYNKKSSF